MQDGIDTGQATADKPVWQAPSLTELPLSATRFGPSAAPDGDDSLNIGGGS